MTIETKFSPGDTVYAIYRDDEVTCKPCKTCGGSGFVDIKGDQFPCPNHCSNGEVRTRTSTYQYEIQTVYCVETKQYENRSEIDIRYVLSNSGLTCPRNGFPYMPESYVFATVDEARAGCERENQRMKELEADRIRRIHDLHDTNKV